MRGPRAARCCSTRAAGHAAPAIAVDQHGEVAAQRPLLRVDHRGGRLDARARAGRVRSAASVSISSLRGALADSILARGARVKLSDSVRSLRRPGQAGRLGPCPSSLGRPVTVADMRFDPGGRAGLGRDASLLRRGLTGRDCGTATPSRCATWLARSARQHRFVGLAQPRQVPRPLGAYRNGSGIPAPACRPDRLRRRRPGAAGHRFPAELTTDSPPAW